MVVFWLQRRFSTYITAFINHLVFGNNGNKNPLIVYIIDLEHKNMHIELFKLLVMLGE